MRREFLGRSSPDHREQFHLHTLQLYAGLLNVVGEYRDVELLPIKGNSIWHISELNELSKRLSREDEVLADFDSVFQEDFYRHSPISKVTSCFEAMNSVSFHWEAIADIGSFLRRWLSLDEDAAKKLTEELIAAGASFDAREVVHLCDLLDDKQIKRVMEGQIERDFYSDLCRQARALRTQFAPILWGGRVHINNLDYVLSKEFARSQELFAAESNDYRTADTNPLRVGIDFVTTSDIATLANADKQTVYNEISKSGKDGAAPKVAEPASGRRPNKYRYSEILPWLRRTWPYKVFPDSYEEAAAIVACQAARKVSGPDTTS
jgi:hypothetical protein